MHYCWNDGEDARVRICFTSAPSPMMPHSQKGMELMYFYKTDGCLYDCNGTQLAPKSGDLIVVNSGEIHACGDWGTACTAVCVILDLSALLPHGQDKLYFKNCITSPEIAHAFERLKTILSEDVRSPLTDCLVLGFAYEILAILTQCARDEAPKVTLAMREKMQFLAAYIEEHFSTAIDVGVLAGKVHLSESRFHHVFKETFGMPPMEYVMRKRVARACTLLADTSLRVTHIAQECGFCTASYFAEIFRKYMRCSPKRYREELCQEDGERALYRSHFDVSL